MSQHQPVDDQPVATPATVMEHPHPLSPVVKGWIALVAMAVGLGRDWLEHLGRHQPDDGGGGGAVALALVGGMLLLYFIITGTLGWFAWRYTQFVVDDTQLRIEHNFIWHKLDQVPFTKIQSVDVVQPFAARLLGLAQVRVDVGAGRPTTIEYLKRERAYQMRDYLVTRAHGRSVTVAESAASGPVAGVLADRAEHEQVLLTVPPQRLVAAALLSTGLLWWLLVTGASLAVGARLGSRAQVLPVLVPLLLALVGSLAHHVVQQWNFQLLRSGQALKVSRGMTSLVSQTLPTSRIQGLSITQDLPWRPLGLYRVRMDVLGYGSGGEDGNQASDLLLPAGTWPEVLTAIDAVWPGFRLEDIEFQPSPRRSRWLNPLSYRWIGWGSTDEVMAARHGFLVRRTTLVHHARVQSVHLHQGPLQRRLRLAHAQLDTTSGGAVRLVARELDQATARELVLAEMERCRRARRRDAERRALDALPRPVAGQLAAVPAGPPQPGLPGDE